MVCTHRRTKLWDGLFYCLITVFENRSQKSHFTILQAKLSNACSQKSTLQPFLAWKFKYILYFKCDHFSDFQTLSAASNKNAILNFFPSLFQVSHFFLFVVCCQGLQDQGSRPSKHSIGESQHIHIYWVEKALNYEGSHNCTKNLQNLSVVCSVKGNI